MSSSQQASKQGSLDHYAVISALVNFKATIVVSKKEWEKALKLMVLEIDENRSKYELLRVQPLSAPQAESSNKKVPSKKSKTAPPAPNSVKQSSEYKALQDQHAELIKLVRDANGSSKDSIFATIRGVETEMKILRGRPNGIASAGSLPASSSVSNMKPRGSLEEPRSARSMEEVYPPLMPMPDTVSTTQRPSQRIKFLLSKDQCLDYISKADRDSITNGLNNGLFSNDKTLVDRWEKARRDFETAAAHRVANGGTRRL